MNGGPVADRFAFGRPLAGDYFHQAALEFVELARGSVRLRATFAIRSIYATNNNTLI